MNVNSRGDVMKRIVEEFQRFPVLDGVPIGLAFDAGEASGKDKRDRALKMILDYGIGIDGDHHKQWVLDQVVRILTGDKYENVRIAHCHGEDGPETYVWDEGIAP